jgi:hypothetical protein
MPRAAQGEGDGREALVLERITGDLWKCSHPGIAGALGQQAEQG